jgi:hypothetical protein
MPEGSRPPENGSSRSRIGASETSAVPGGITAHRAVGLLQEIEKLQQPLYVIEDAIVIDVIEFSHRHQPGSPAVV